MWELVPSSGTLKAASMNLNDQGLRESRSSKSFVGPMDHRLRRAGSHPTDGIQFSLKPTSKPSKGASSPQGQGLSAFPAWGLGI
jgi:hypothetical protein